MTNYEILETVQKEYREYKAYMMDAGAEEIWSSSSRVTAWRYIKDYLEGNADSGENLLARLYDKAGECILSTLVSRYMKGEGCDIGSWSDIRELVLDYLEYVK